MYSHNPTTYYCHICHTPTMPCLCAGCHASLYAFNPKTQWYNNLLPYEGPPQNPGNNPGNPIFDDQEAMVTSEIDPWSLLNSDNGQDQNFNPYQYQGQFNHHGNYGMEQQQQQIYNFSGAPFHNTPVGFMNPSLPASNGGYSNTEEFPREWSVDEFSFLPFHHGSLTDETIGSNSNSNSLSSEGKQHDASNKLYTLPPTSKQERILRYYEKKKSRKYEKKIKNTSRRTYAQTRPRVRGRFARKSEVDAQ